MSKSGYFERLLLLILLALLGACAASPRDRLSARAERYGLHESEVASAQFKHLLLRNYVAPQSEQLNVYLEGDGTPWILRLFRSADPTPRYPLMLTLMARDTTPALYLGRPCYNERVRSSACNTTHWTSGRYSAQVVDSMAAILSEEIDRLGVKTVELYGHSGGGALALLLAEKIPQTIRVLTLAGNLDTEAWIAHHGYSSLYTSINPAKRPPLSSAIEQIHLMGSEDSNIPPSLVSNWVVNQANSYGVIYAGFDHGCCWSDMWVNLLHSLRAGAPYNFDARVIKQPSDLQPKFRYRLR